MGFLAKEHITARVVSRVEEPFVHVCSNYRAVYRAKSGRNFEIVSVSQLNIFLNELINICMQIFVSYLFNWQHKLWVTWLRQLRDDIARLEKER